MKTEMTRECGHDRTRKVVELFGVRKELRGACEFGCNDVDRVRESTIQSLASSVSGYCSAPHRFYDATFDETTPPAIRKALERAVDAMPDYRSRWDEPAFREAIPRIVIRGRGIGIFGNNGSGKSFAAGAYLRLARERLIPGIMVAATDLQLEIEDAERFDSAQSKRAVVARYARAALLVIDDFDKLVASTASVAVAMYELIDARSRENRPICITTNMAPRELASAVFGRHARHGVGVDDRWLEMLDWIRYPGDVSRRGGPIA